MSCHAKHALPDNCRTDGNHGIPENILPLPWILRWRRKKNKPCNYTTVYRVWNEVSYVTDKSPFMILGEICNWKMFFWLKESVQYSIFDSQRRRHDHKLVLLPSFEYRWRRRCSPSVRISVSSFTRKSRFHRPSICSATVYYATIRDSRELSSLSSHVALRVLLVMDRTQNRLA